MITYRFGPFQLLPDQRRLERDGAAVPMTPKAFDLLVARFVAPVIEENDASGKRIDSPHCLIWNDREVPLREGITLIGRADDVDLRIPLPSVSSGDHDVG